MDEPPPLSHATTTTTPTSDDANNDEPTTSPPAEAPSEPAADKPLEHEPTSTAPKRTSKSKKPARLTLSSDELLESLRVGNLPEDVNSEKADMPSRSALRRRTRRSMASSASAVSPPPHPWPQQPAPTATTTYFGGVQHDAGSAGEGGAQREGEGSRGGGEVSASESDLESEGGKAEGIERWMRDQQPSGAAEGGGKPADEGYGSEELDEGARRTLEEEPVKVR